ncbi:MAG: hypothetical protein KBT28_06905 [Bacteroidales bacterium]|nr:hypothetical protein [Candidatus Colimorpha merdihippi]
MKKRICELMQDIADSPLTCLNFCSIHFDYDDNSVYILLYSKNDSYQTKEFRDLKPHEVHAIYNDLKHDFNI